MKLIVGLGNPGREYERTRHNIGFRVIDALADKLGLEPAKDKFKGHAAQGNLPEAWQGAASGDGKVLLVKPQTYMNLSGETVVGYMGYFKIALEDVLIVVDDVALELGTLRLRAKGSAGGHNGLKNIQQRLGNNQDYARLKIGVGPQKNGKDEEVFEDLADFVLGKFRADEEEQLSKIIEKSVEACLTWSSLGVEKAMNKVNQQPPKPKIKKQEPTGKDPAGEKAKKKLPPFPEMPADDEDKTNDEGTFFL